MSETTISHVANAIVIWPARRPSGTAQLQTLAVGEIVRISLKGKHSDNLNGWLGRVVAVDAVAIRIAATASRFDWTWSDAEGEHVVPWSRVDFVVSGGVA